MRMAKRVFLFVAVNIGVIVTISILLNVLGVKPYLTAQGIDYGSLLAFCAVWGFGGAFISLAISRKMAKWSMGVKLVDPQERDPVLAALVERVYAHSRAAGLGKMPEVGYYESDELNAFATGPTRNRALVAVSTGLLARMTDEEVDGVLAHEVAHIANGDMVTMTLLQGVVNVFVMFLARVAGFFASQFVEEEKRPLVQFGIVIVLEILLGILGMVIVSAFSRMREYRADAGGARLAGRDRMVAALRRLQRSMGQQQGEDSSSAIAAFKISGKSGGLAKWFSTHPDLQDRIDRLEYATSS